MTKTNPALENIDICQASTEPDEQELDNLGAGCYVQVNDGDSCFWVEITAVDGDEFIGTLHCELGGSTCQPTKQNQLETHFNKNQIVNLGCDNYCWC